MTPREALRLAGRSTRAAFPVERLRVVAHWIPAFARFREDDRKRERFLERAPERGESAPALTSGRTRVLPQ